MDNLIPQLYKEYGLYINHSRAFPDSVDGLKPVERRVLLSTYQIARDKFVKSAKVDGHVIGNFHPHSSCYSTMVQLVGQGFLDGQGNWGNNVGVEPSPAAAMRYTECRLSKKTFDIALRLIDHVDWVESELDNEPEYFPTMFPLCLLGKEYTIGIGFGYKTSIPCYEISDLKNRLLFLIGKTTVKPTIKPVSNCKILSTNEELESLLTTGKGSISFQGIFKVDNVKCKAVIKSWPPGKRFESILGKFEKELLNQDIGFTDESSEENKGTHIVFEVLKQRNRDEIFKSFVKKLGDVLTSSVSFEMIVVDHDTKNVKNMTVDEMLVSTFKSYLKTNLRMLKSNEEKLISNISELKLLEKIKIPLPKYLKNTEFNIDEISEKIGNEISEDKNSVKELLQKYRITKLFTYKIDFDELDEKLKSVKSSIDNIGEFVVSQYNIL